MERYRIVGRRGFTLVETVIVIVLAGIMAAVALPRFAESRRSYQVDSAAHQLAGDLRRAQVEAIRRNRTIELFVSSASTYRIRSVPPPSPIVVYYTRSLDPPVTFGAGATSVRLRSFGPPTTGAASFIVQNGPVQKTVNVSAAGLVSVQ
jgi:prepilin-type N-terminal cleavage/methylation domain-containing protein